MTEADVVLPEENTLYFYFLESFPRGHDMECATSTDRDVFFIKRREDGDWEVSHEAEVSFTTRQLFKYVCEVMKPLRRSRRRLP